MNPQDKSCAEPERQEAKLEWENGRLQGKKEQIKSPRRLIAWKMVFR